jgi:hypothetical protein
MLRGRTITGAWIQLLPQQTIVYTERAMPVEVTGLVAMNSKVKRVQQLQPNLLLPQVLEMHAGATKQQLYPAFRLHA